MVKKAAILTFILGLILAACGQEDNKGLPELLPLAADKPTFVFFSTTG